MENQLLETTLIGLLQICKEQQEQMHTIGLSTKAVIAALAHDSAFPEKYKEELETLTASGHSYALSGQLGLIDIAIADIRRQSKVIE
ncbi:MAG: hypothetical protein M3Y72_05070 [Acidobacteriota bacterium]|nr:hypothetical protein [Acidobacteriota bacterium]